MKRSYFDKLFSSVTKPAFTVIYWDQTEHLYGAGVPQFSIRILREPSPARLMEPLSILFGDTYVRGDMEVEGSFSAVAAALDNAYANLGGHRAIAMLSQQILSGLHGFGQSLVSAQKKDIAKHYDIGNSFFKLWLDEETRSYSCGYFKHPDDSLGQAQKNKIALILKKMHLKPGMRLLDIGCGWGGMAQEAVDKYDANVLAITLSEEQFFFVKKLFSKEPYRGKAEVRLCSYTDLESARSFDRVVSVGMFEHVGKKHYPAYFEKIRQLLKPGGLSLLHTLTKHKPGRTDPWIEKYIFPGGHIPALSELIKPLARHGFHLLHVESFRRHYVKTLQYWRQNFSRPDVVTQVQAMYGKEFVRMWDLYLRMAAAYLDIGGLDVHQFVFTKGVSQALPMTLEGIYN